MKHIFIVILLAISWTANAQRFVNSFNTIAEMLASTSLNSVSTNINVLGYYAPLDGGGGQFSYDKTSTVATNLGTVFKPTSLAGRLLRVVENSTVNARMFGAKGDATTDDTLAVQAMLDWRENGRPGTMQLTVGYYRWSTVTGSGGKLEGVGHVEYGVDTVPGSSVVCEQLLGATNHFIRVNAPTLYPGKPSMTISGLNLIGHPEYNLRNPVLITEVFPGDRFHFSVASAPTLTNPKGGNPYYGFGAIFTDDNQYLGTFCLNAFRTNGVTGDLLTVEVAAQTDAYATVAGEDVLRVGFKVCFPEMKDFYYQNALYTTQPSSANAGYAAIEINDSGTTIIEKVTALAWHTGIVCASESLEVKDFTTYSILYSSLMSEPFGGTFADANYTGFVLLNGKYQRDGALAAGIHTLKDKIYQSQAIGIGAWGAQTHGDRIVAGPSALYGAYMYGAVSCTVNDLLIEGVGFRPVYITQGNTTYPQGPNVINTLRVHTPEATQLVPTNRPTTLPVISIAGSSAKIVVMSLQVGPFIRTSPSLDWKYGSIYDWPAYLLNDGLVAIGQFSDQFGLVTVQKAASSLDQQFRIPGGAVFSGGIGGVDPVAVFERPGATRYGWTISNGLRLNFGADVDGSGAVVTANIVGGSVTSYTVTNGGSGYTDNKASVTITGDGTGAYAIPVLLGGVVTSVTMVAPGHNYTTATATVNPVPKLDDVGFAFNRTTTTSTLTLGTPTGLAAPIAGVVEAERALTGTTDQNGGNLQLRPGRGIGAASNASLQLARSVPTTSGTADQAFLAVLEILQDGTVYFDPLTVDPATGANGSVFMNSVDGTLKLRQGGQWRWIQTGLGRDPNRFGTLMIDTELPTAFATVTISVASPAVVSFTAHGLAAGTAVVFSTTGLLPTGVELGRAYYVDAAGLNVNDFQILSTKGGATVNTSGTQSGTHTCFPRGAVYPAAPSNWENVIVLNAPLTADRAVSISSSGAVPGQKWTFVRTVNSTGAFNWDIAGLHNLVPSSWADVEWNGVGYILTRTGTL